MWRGLIEVNRTGVNPIGGQGRPFCSTPTSPPQEEPSLVHALPFSPPPLPPPFPSLDGWLSLSDRQSQGERSGGDDSSPLPPPPPPTLPPTLPSPPPPPPPEAEADEPTTPAGGFTPLDPEKYKTELCRSYQVHGYCRYGARCNYAHGLRQLRGAARHGKYKTRNCLSYHLTGSCRYGSRCSFIHDPEEGVLKCSIANKEVLEALYYFPSCEDSSRTASITWRLQEAGSFPSQELHLITTNRALEDDLGLISSSSSSSSSSSPEASPPPEEDLPGGALRTLPFWDAPSEGGGERDADEAGLLRKRVFERARGSRGPEDRRLLLLLPPRRSRRKRGRRRRLSWTAGFDPPKEEAEAREPMGEYLKGLEVVRGILREAPQYSTAVWSDGTGGGPPPQRRALVPLSRKEEEEEGSGRRPRGSGSKEGGGGEDPNSSLRGRTSASTSEDSLGSSGGARPNDAEEEEEEEEREEEWSGTDSLHLADLFRSLRLRENQQPSWASDASPSTTTTTTTAATAARRRQSHDLTKYKTELCRSFQYNGYCEYSEACLYAHGSPDLRCYPRHPMYRTKQCFSFHRKGFCLYGSRCQFLHHLE